MSSASTAINNQVNIDDSGSNIPQKEIVISIILSESTASLLELGAPNLQDLLNQESSTSLFSARNLNYLGKDSPTDRPSGQDLKLLFSGQKYKDIDYINVDEVFFAKNFESNASSIENFDDIVNDENDDESDNDSLTNNSEVPPLMEKFRVYTRPLVSAKTTAHDDKLKCKCNNIYLSVLESELTITSSGWVNFCRICHGGESVANLITPCRCRGSIALAHLQCLEEWLRQSANSKCELCQHRYEVIREPKYSIPWSIIIFLTHPGDRLRELIYDIIGLLIYTPTAIATTYLLMVLCDNIAMKNNLQCSRNFANHFLAFTAVFGMATIDFTYSSWLVVMLQRHLDAWKQWYQNNCTLHLLLPPRKLRRHTRKLKEIAATQLD